MTLVPTEFETGSASIRRMGKILIADPAPGGIYRPRSLLGDSSATTGPFGPRTSVRAGHGIPESPSHGVIAGFQVDAVTIDGRVAKLMGLELGKLLVCLVLLTHLLG